jgi:hypothetical protein
MQFTKDSIYLALRERLSALNPARTIIVDGSERPAVLVVENEAQNAAPPQPNAYYLSWSAPQIVAGSEEAARPLMKMECRIVYAAASTMAGAVDRGRALTELDSELLRLLSPPRTAKLDVTQTPAGALGTYVFWGVPVLDDVPPSAKTGRKGGPPDLTAGLTRAATVSVFFFPEVEQA